MSVAEGAEFRINAVLTPIPGHIMTYTGKLVSPLALRPEDIDPRDVAHSLAQQCRYTGHTRVHYSVAQHCVYVSTVLPRPLKLAGLLHDASEAYLMDLAAPLKRLPEFAAFREIEARLQRAVETRFGLAYGALDAPEIHVADRRVLQTEARSLMAPGFPTYAEPYAWAVEPWTPVEAEAEWLDQFDALGGV